VRIFFSIRPLQEGDPGYEDRKDTHTARVIYMNSSENRFYNDASGSVQYINIALNLGHFFVGLDNDNEDNIFDLAGIALWTRALNEIDIDLLGPGFPETAH
ncbi:MAG: hypothetical protein LBT50_02755, partial [Prevotellaceae bacterium]|nr:hypothetical protein [Prevotellaceae bacterium]